MFKGKKGLSTPAIIGILVLLASVIVFGVSQSTFDIEQGYEPYGESPNEITGLERDVENIDCFVHRIEDILGDNLDCTLSESRYWHIKRVSNTQGGFYDLSGTSDFSGNDFEMTATSSTQRRTRGDSNMLVPIKFETTEFMHNREFAFNIEGASIDRSETTSGLLNGRYGVSAIKPNGDRVGITGSTLGEQSTDTIRIRPSPATDFVTISRDGEKSTKEISGNYTIEITLNIPARKIEDTGPSITSSMSIIEPRYKQQFGCTTEPDEQVYVETFQSNTSVSLEDLDNFQKFCLDELPTQVISNTGATSDTSIQTQLIEGNEFTVPTGQIWAVQYIGEKGTLETECEEGEVSSDGDCFATGAITYSCPDGSFNPETLSCQVTTEPVVYQPTSIETHQDLETEGSVRFDHQVSDAFDESTTKSFNILGNTFVSNGVSYSGNTETDSLASEEPNNFATQVNIAGQSYSLSEGDSQTLGDFLNVEIANLEADYDAPEDNLPGGIENFNIQYDFGIDRSILDIEESNGQVTVTNNKDQSIEGGLVVRRTDNTQQTSIETQDEIFSSGENSFSFDTENLRDLRIRPFATIETDAYEYNIDGETALILEIEDGELVSSERVDSETLEPIETPQEPSFIERAWESIKQFFSNIFN